jgi:VanZ family protein
MLGMQAPTAPNKVPLKMQTLQAYDARKSNPAEFRSSLMSIMRLASIVLIAYWALIFVGTHLPSARMPSLHASDKICHFVAFTGLSFLLCWAIPSSRVSWGKILLLAASIAITYAVLDELTQQFIPGRTCDIWDVAADSVGVLLGLITYSIARCLVGRIKWAQRLVLPNV